MPLNVVQRLEPLERLARQGSEEAAEFAKEAAEFLATVYESKAAAATQRERQSGADW